MLNVKIKKLYPDAKVPTYGSAKAAACDLYAYLGENYDAISKDGRKYIEIKSHCTKKVSSGFSLEPPSGYCSLLFARSGMAIKFGLVPATQVSIIDEDYRGELIIPIHNDSNQDKRVYDGERIAQLMFAPYTQAAFEEADSLSDTERGEGGFGSTGNM